MSDIYDHLDMKGASRIQNLPAPATDNEPARNIDLKNAVEGLKQKDPVRVATQSNINLASPGASLDGVALASGNRVLVKAQTAPAENGIYVWTGAASAMTRAIDGSTAAELNGSLIPVAEGTNAGQNWRQTAVIATLGTDAVTFAQFGSGVAPATTTTQGTVEIATQAEVNAGTDTARSVTPETLAGWTGRKYKNGATYGDATATQFDVTHNFATLDVQIATYRVSTGERVYPKETAFSVNVARVNFTVAPGINEFRTVVIA